MAVFAVFRLPVSAADPDYTFSSGAVLLDNSYSGKNILIQNGVFSVTVSGATNVNIIFDSVTMDRRYGSDQNMTVEGLYNVAQSLGWVNNGTYIAQTCPLLLTNGASATVAFRGVNNFYAGTNKCTVNSGNWYTKNQSGGGFAGVQVDAGSTLTISPSGGTLNAYGAFYVEGDNSENSSYGYGAPSGVSVNQLAGGAGIGGGAAWNTTTSASSSYTAGTPGTIIINGGNINAHGGHQAAGIGGGLNGAATNTSVTINGGNVNAYGGRWAAGIGDGDSLQDNWTTKYTDNYSIVISGGRVNAVGGVGCPGIGTTDEVSTLARRGTSGLTINLNGGEITAKSGYPDKFNPQGTAGYSGTDAAAAIGAGNKTNMESNSISVSSVAKIIASGFGHYSVTENGVQYSALPTVNIDSDGYAFLGRFPELASSGSRVFELFEAQRFDTVINGETYQYRKYVTQPADGSTGEIYYYCAEAPDNRWLLKAGADGSIGNSAVVPLDSLPALENKMDELMLTLHIDENSVKIGEVAAPAHFRSIALSLPNPQEHGGIYALKIPTAAMYGYSGTAVLPKSGYATITIGAEEQGTLSGEIAYPSHMNIKADSVSAMLTDLDIYRDGQYTDGRNGLVGDSFMENVFAYRIYIEHDDNFAYLYAKYAIDDNVNVSIEPFGMTVSEQTIGTDRIITATLDMTGVTEKVIRLKKTDTVTVEGKTITLNSVVYKITVVKKALYKIELNALNRIYDGTEVRPSILRLYSEETGAEYAATDAELNSVFYSYYAQEGTLWTELGTVAPKNAGQYKISAVIHADTFTAMSETEFTIAKRTLTVNRIQNPLTYVSAAEHAGWTAPRDIQDPGMIYLSGVVGADEVSASAVSVFYNDISIGYRVDKITLTGITLSGADVGNYETADTQKVFGQISYSLDGAIFRKKPGMTWDKFYPVDSPLPVAPGTADWHSPATGGVYDSHRDYVYARTENMGNSQSVYAVDIEFGSMYFTYSMSEWNAGTMVYEELVGESRWTGFEGGNNEIVVTNRSNSPIWYTPNAKIDFLHSAIGDSPVGIKANFYADNSSSGTPITGVWQEVSAATAGDRENFGVPTTGVLTINVTSGDWNAVAEYYAAKKLNSFNQATDTFTVATVTVTITKD